jgi:hypothetical protein
MPLSTIKNKTRMKEKEIMKNIGDKKLPAIDVILKAVKGYPTFEVKLALERLLDKILYINSEVT